MDHKHRIDIEAPERAVPKKRHVLGVAFLAFLVPLLVLLGLQYSWLTDLEKASAIARQVQHESYLKRISKEIWFFYDSLARRALSLDATLLDPQYISKVGKFFKKHGGEGASRFFIVSFLNQSEPYWFYESDTFQMVTPQKLETPQEITPGFQAVIMASSPWRILYKKGDVVDDAVLIDEVHRGQHVILKPITDEDSKVVGLAGLIVDPEYFRDQVLPRAVQEALPAFSPADEVIVQVRDEQDRTVWSSDPEVTGGSKDQGLRHREVRRAIPFVFTDWRLALWGRASTPEQWARSNFAFNVTLSLVLAAVLLGGLALVLRTAAREMRLSEMKNHFVSNVSHELRTPLASIRVFGELLRLGRVGSPEKMREYGEYIETESRRLTQLINNILDFSRIESGRWGYEFEPADLEEIVADVLKTFEIRLRKSGFEIDVRGPSAPLGTVRVDREAVRQALFNLLDNAVKYSGDGREIVVHLERRDTHAVVAVEDHGIGISRAAQKKIFERFHRGGTSLVHDIKGTGLGLSIVDHIVRAHGGEVRLESEPGAGSTFSIHLPIEPAADVPEPSPVSSEEGGLRLQQSG